MTAFFVKTDGSAAGPFTGIELREATLAGIVHHDSQIGGGPAGPWTRASDTGLFSQQKLPLPHPPGTHVPTYQVRGMQGGLTGPFKLRELVGFAAHGMLPPDVMLKSDLSDEWISLQRIPVLVACLSGSLVLLGESGKVHLRTRSAKHGQRSDSGQFSEAVHAPGKRSRSINVTHAAFTPPQGDVPSEGVVDEDEDREIDQAVGGEVVRPQVESAATDDSPGRQPWRQRFRLPRLNLNVPTFLSRRLIINAACVLLVMLGLGAAYSYWRNIGMGTGAIIGDWIVDGDSGPLFGVSFREDGSLVVFNTTGNSFQGDYLWANSAGTAGFRAGNPFSVEIDKLGEGHQPGTIKPTDGYIRLRGFVDQPPRFGGHVLVDCFLRREGENLNIGYLTKVTWTPTEKRIEAGWMHAHPARGTPANIIDELSQIAKENPPVRGYQVDESLHLSEAIDHLRNSQAADALDGDVNGGTLCHSELVNAAYLLKHYGVPDEARPIQPFEVPHFASGGPSFQGAQLVRYGLLTMILRNDGTIQHVSIMF